MTDSIVEGLESSSLNYNICNLFSTLERKIARLQYFSGISCCKLNVELIREGKVSEESIDKTRSRIKELRAKAQYDQCSNCFSEASRIFDKQINLMRSLNVYRESRELKSVISALPVELIVEQMLDPLSNRQRMQIMKALSSETKTFSALSTLTGLRGGNLLFHLQKLLDSGMIMQRSERGDYMITEKGYKALRGIVEVYLELNSKELAAESSKIQPTTAV